MADDQQQTQHIVVDSFSPWERRLEKHGWPTLMLVAMLLLGWRITSWLQPKIDESIKEHFAFMRKTTETQEKQAENGAAIATQQEKISDILSRQEQRTVEISERLRDVHQAVIKPK